MSEQSHPESLEDFVAGRKTEAENAAILEHLTDCERCAAEVETLWAESPASRLLPEISEPDPKSLAALEGSLFRRIHRADLGGQVIKLGTQGFINFLSAIFQPVLSGRRTSREGGHQDDRS